MEAQQQSHVLLLPLKRLGVRNERGASSQGLACPCRGCSRQAFPWMGQSELIAGLADVQVSAYKIMSGLKRE